jgi:hypothetical protein
MNDSTQWPTIIPNSGDPSVPVAEFLGRMPAVEEI